ncbi:MAG: nitrous oxide reductase family maturation protein NosD, partial [Chitinophagaceae bacterium]
MSKYVLTTLLVFLINPAIAQVLRVGKAHSFKTIKAALAAAKDGDTVEVEAGLYKEQNIIIDKQIVFKGIGHPVLDGEKKYEVISIKANNVVIDGFKVIRSGVSSIVDMGGIKVYDAEGVVVKNNIIEETFFGIYIQYGKNCSIINNKMVSSNKVEQQSGNGIHCWKSDSM